jgi:hypothetical protein
MYLRRAGQETVFPLTPIDIIQLTLTADACSDYTASSHRNLEHAELGFAVYVR